ncbi:protein WVD2-like 1 [Magnolia sinica]|uniref:protein WVD2-like 1 n=1 Tax=Magnolia sinica TaxID=86752 RepID=UPI0026588BF0|nr:protein WVD2-like 1 [Magnolia sinica]
MKEKEEIRQSNLPQQNGEEEEGSNSCNEPTQENKQNQQLEETSEDRAQLENQAVSLTNQDPIVEAENGCGEETKLGNRAVLLQKPKAAPKQNHKMKLTVPQPFSLATEKRMSRERRGVGPAHSSPNLSKSASLNVRPDRSSEPRHGAAPSRSTLKPGERPEKRTEPGHKMKEKAQTKEVEVKKSQPTDKVGSTVQGEVEIKKLGKSSTFKASPLPSFYHKKAPPKPELKKIPSMRPKSPPLHRRSKSISEQVSNKTETINRSKSVSEPANGKTETINRNSSKATTSIATIPESSNGKTMEISKSATRTISSTAKEAINRLLRGSWKSPKTVQSKESSAKARNSCGVGGGLEKVAAATADEGNGVLVT